ncbi:hypothetical protein K3G63_04605 [Hymenobacter sp. HSC-4F20]|uniref:hypothetical protein n=1 Tax=Hymenobacter sp. HSC-4F20 TaxID=2864135 RepID=UPI001C72F86C|nr:hypothetical protein [Hymenobacter sp. HSC-4F20]MBX0289704.1 hypothetical protein [Hymenobacter sp. HSC-4F20]
MNSEGQHLNPSEQAPVDQAALARSVVFADILRRFDELKRDEDEEYARHEREVERHREEIGNIQEAMHQVGAALEALRTIYPGLEAKLATTNEFQDSIKDFFAKRKQNDTEHEKPRRKKNSVFVRGELRDAIVRVITERDTFLLTDEVAEGVHQLLPDKEFENKLVADGLKDGRKSDLVGVAALRGNYKIMLSALPHFYELDETETTVLLRDKYRQKLHERLQDLGLTLAGTENDFVSKNLFKILKEEYSGLLRMLEQNVVKEKSAVAPTTAD